MESSVSRWCKAMRVVERRKCSSEDVPDLVLKAEDPPAVTEAQGRVSQGKGALDYAGDDGHTRASTGFGNVGAT